MAYTNSSLVNYTKISPMKDIGRKHPTYNPSGVIDKITIHHMAGNLSVETCGNVFQTREASANYGIGSDGRIALYVDEKDRSWASSSAANDYRAVTIEVANNTGSPNWTVSNAAYASLIKLVVDICKRNNIKQLNFTGNKNGNLTMHSYFAATACPGPYLKARFGQIASEVNAQLNASTSSSTGSFNKGDVVQFKGGAHYKSATATTPSSSNLKPGPAKITAISKGAHPYHIIHTDSQTTVYGWVDAVAIGASSISESAGSSSKNTKVIDEDGIWGIKTTTYTQKLLKTVQDGIVSSQKTSCKKYLPAVDTRSWEFTLFGRGSVMVIALQRYIGMSDKDIDGLVGYYTVVALQNFLENKNLYSGAIDGIMGEGTVTGWQKYLNSKF